MFAECRHILPSGLKCKSPAIRNRHFCYFHSGLRRYSADATSARKEPLILPSLEDLRGVQIAITQVLSAFAHGRIDRREVGAYLYGLQLTTRIAIHIATHENPASTHENPASIRSITCDDSGADLAEEQNTCEPPHDCLACPNRETCKNFENYESEVEELEEQLAEQEEEQEQDPAGDEEEDIDEADEDEEEDDSEEEDDEYDATEEDEDDHDQDDKYEDEYNEEDEDEQALLKILQGCADHPCSDPPLRHEVSHHAARNVSLGHEASRRDGTHVSSGHSFRSLLKSPRMPAEHFVEHDAPRCGCTHVSSGHEASGHGFSRADKSPSI